MDRDDGSASWSSSKCGLRFRLERAQVHLSEPAYRRLPDIKKRKENTERALCSIGRAYGRAKKKRKNEKKEKKSHHSR